MFEFFGLVFVLIMGGVVAAFGAVFVATITAIVAPRAKGRFALMAWAFVLPFALLLLLFTSWALTEHNRAPLTHGYEMVWMENHYLVQTEKGGVIADPQMPQVHAIQVTDRYVFADVTREIWHPEQPEPNEKQVRDFQILDMATGEQLHFAAHTELERQARKLKVQLKLEDPSAVFDRQRDGTDDSWIERLIWLTIPLALIWHFARVIRFRRVVLAKPA